MQSLHEPGFKEKESSGGFFNRLSKFFLILEVTVKLERVAESLVLVAQLSPFGQLLSHPLSS